MSALDCVKFTQRGARTDFRCFVKNYKATIPYLRTVRAGDRATEFKQRCNGLDIKGVTLHSYRYAWAERAKTAGYPERFAMENLGHNSKAVHRAYARKAQVELPSLSEYERQRKLFANGGGIEPVAQAITA